MPADRPGPVGRLLNLPFLAAIALYRVTLSPILGGQCRYYPTCSRYADEAYRRWGPFVGTWLTVRRVGRCHPLGGSGVDPVPMARDELPWPAGRPRA